jgi:hypothetical protein
VDTPAVLSRAIGPFAAGTAGVVALAPVAAAAVGEQLTRAGQPEPALLLLLVSVQPLILLAAASLIGAALAQRLELRSRLAAWPVHGLSAWTGMTYELRPAIVGGSGAAVAILLADLAMRTQFTDVRALPPLTAQRDWQTLSVAVLYGGVTEEVLMRWGLMSAIAWLVKRVQGPVRPPPAPAVMWSAIVIAAVLFGVGHLPAVAISGVPLTAAIIIRTILLNTAAGIVFGWIFWRRSLEAAMVSHASTHLTWALAAVLFRVRA